MHGFIFNEMKKYVTLKLGSEKWAVLLLRAGVAGKIFANYMEYPDAEAVGLVVQASEVTGLPAGAILEDFGEFLGTDLLTIYRPLLDEQWRTLDFLENTESLIHEIVRTRNPNASPPTLACTRLSPDEVLINYQSPRKLCELAKGLIQGVAKHFKETVSVTEGSCMLQGDSRCLMFVRRVL